MIDVRQLREHADETCSALARRGDVTCDGQVKELLELDQQLRVITARRDEARAKINVLSREVGQLRRDGNVEQAEAVQAESRALGEEVGRIEGEHETVSAKMHDLLLHIPNVPHPDVPAGVSDNDNPVVNGPFLPDGGIDGFAAHQRVPHWEIGEALGILDNERATKIAASMFTMQRGAGATMARALCQYALDSNADEFEEIRPPSLVSTATLTSTGQLPKFADDAYAIERDDLWCIPTAEVPLTSLYGGEILDAGELPARFMAYSPCFRREAGSAGRDTRGMLRAHEFDKVEILALATPEQAPGLLSDMVARVERMISSLGLHHRVIEICTGDLGQSHHRSFDIEVYAPGCEQWLEVSSVSWFSDYQARRADIRYRQVDADGKPVKGTVLVHTLNGSALAVPRVWAAILETHRQADGTVAIPEVLWPYMRGLTALGG